MNNKTLFKWFSMLLLMMVAGISGVAAQSLTIADFSIKAGETKDVAITLATDQSTIYGIQTDIVLSEGLTLERQVAIDQSLSFASNVVSTGATRVSLFSQTGATIASGDVVTLSVKAAQDFSQGTIQLTNSRLTTSNAGTELKVADATANVTVDGAVEDVYTIAGTSDLTGSDWQFDEANNMTFDPTTGLYTWTKENITVSETAKPEFKVVKNNDWNTCWPDNNWVITPDVVGGEGVYTITITFNAETTEIGVTGVKSGDAPGPEVPGEVIWSSDEAQAIDWGTANVKMEADVFANAKVGDILHVVLQDVPTDASNTWDAQVLLRANWKDLDFTQFVAGTASSAPVEVASFTITGDILKFIKTYGAQINGNNCKTSKITLELAPEAAGSENSVWVGEQNTHVWISPNHFKNFNDFEGIKVGDVIRVTLKEPNWVGMNYNKNWDWTDFPEGSFETTVEAEGKVYNFTVLTEEAVAILNDMVEEEGNKVPTTQVIINVGGGPATVTQVELLKAEDVAAEITKVVLLGDWNNWSQDAEMEASAAAGNTWIATIDGTDITTDIQLKLLVNGDNWLGYNDVTINAPEGWVTGPVGDYGNIQLNHTTTGFLTYTVTASWSANIDAAKGWTLTIAGKDESPTAEDVYTVAGTTDLTGTAEAFAIDPANNMTRDAAGLYTWTKESITVSATAQPAFKVVKNAGRSSETWYPEGGESTNWVITPDYLGEEGVYTITITFNPENNEIGVAGVKTGDIEVPGPEDPEPTVPEGWTNAITNGNLAGDDVSNYKAKEYPSTAIVDAAIVDGAGKNGGRGIVVKAGDETEVSSAQDWDSQFWIVLPDALPSGTKLHVEFDYRASKEALANTQSHGEPGGYQHWACIGDVNFTESWAHFSKDIEIDDAMAKGDNGNGNGVGLKSIAFNLAVNKTGVDYFFDNFGVWYQNPTVISDWTDLIVNGDMEGENTECFYVTEQGVGGPFLAKFTDGIGKNGGKAVKVQSADNPAQDWDSQFFIRLPYQVPAGTKYRVSFDYKADKAGGFDTQSHAEPGQYIHWACIGSGDFTTEWKSYTKEGTIPAECDGSESKDGDGNVLFLKIFQTIAFNLAKNKEATEFIFDNVKFEVPTDVLSTLTKNPAENPTPYPNDAEISKVQLLGTWNWDVAVDNVTLTKSADADKVYTGVLDLSNTAADQEFKLVINGDVNAIWIGNGSNMVIDAPEGWVVGLETGEWNYQLKNATTGYKTYNITATWAGGDDAGSGWTLKIEGKDAREASSLPDGYYVVGNMNDWTPTEGYMLELNEAAAPTEEYTITLDLEADAQFKIAKVENGVIVGWYPDPGDNYGANGELDRGKGSYAIYFRPNGDGEAGWFNGLFYVEYKGEATLINGLNLGKYANAEWYTIQGVRIDRPTTKGLYIRNGRSVVVK